MGCFLGVTKGSTEPPKFLEIHYNPFHREGDKADDSPPIVFVGKGVTFDRYDLFQPCIGCAHLTHFSGGISIKPSEGMGMMRGDMGGAAAVVSTLWALASLQLPAKAIALTPLCGIVHPLPHRPPPAAVCVSSLSFLVYSENMPSGTAMKPGDVLRAKNGKTVEVFTFHKPPTSILSANIRHQVDNTDAEGRLILADALVYANSFKPAAIIDVATLTGFAVL